MVLKLSILETIMLAITFYIIGDVIRKNIKFINYLCIPSPIVGGLLFAILRLVLNEFNILEVNINAVYSNMLIHIFFITIGLGISIKIIKNGGRILLKYWILCAILAFIQNILMICLSKIIKINSLLSLMCGSISMEGGHGYAVAFGETIGKMGVKNAVGFGMTAATFGLIFGGILGGPVAKFLIVKYRLKRYKTKNSQMRHSKKRYSGQRKTSKIHINLDSLVFLEQLLLILVIINIAEIISTEIFKTYNIVIPIVVICMLLSVLLRNLNDKLKIIKVDFELIDFIGDISLGMFLTLSIMNLDLYKLSSYLLIILFLVMCQVLFIIIYGVFICFKVLGKDYDAAVIISGLIGHGIGSTPNAMSNMFTITEKYGDSKALFIVPLVSSFLLDIVSVPCILFFINILR